jgi:hypothetical protein
VSASHAPRYGDPAAGGKRVDPILHGERGVFARLLAMLVAMREILKELEAKNQTLFASIDRQVRDFFAHFEAAIRPTETEKEEPPRCH